ncbi:unnamed protein product [Gadus morhua 'NCC']
MAAVIKAGNGTASAPHPRHHHPKADPYPRPPVSSWNPTLLALKGEILIKTRRQCLPTHHAAIKETAAECSYPSQLVPLDAPTLARTGKGDPLTEPAFFFPFME